jgi:ribosomal protein L37E
MTRKGKTDRRAAPASLTPEERSIFTLGKNAERFVAADREAREIRHWRNLLLQSVNSTHLDNTPCYMEGVKDQFDRDDEQDTNTEETLPASEWCEDCRRYAEAHNAAVFAYYSRRSAKGALSAAYRRLLRVRQSASKISSTQEDPAAAKRAEPNPGLAADAWRHQQGDSSMTTDIEVVLECPSCGEQSLHLSDGDPVCSACEWTDSAETAADSYTHYRFPSWKDRKNGPDDEIGTCEACGYNAVAPLHESDMVGTVQQKLQQLRDALDLEPGAGDAGYGLCFSCGEVSLGRPRHGSGPCAT